MTQSSTLNAPEEIEISSVQRTALNSILQYQSYISGNKKDNFCDSKRLSTDLGLDSLDVVEVIMAIEEEFNIEINDDEAIFKNLESATVGMLATLILENVNKQ